MSAGPTGQYQILAGDVLDRLRDLPPNSADGLLCDPPYGLRFMGKAWDYDVPSVEVWKEALRVLKPGAPLLAFGGSRTFHRLAVAIEDAGFELRDTIMWIYGSGFPKSQNVSIAIDKAAGKMGHRGVGVNVAGRGKHAELLVAGPVAKHEPVTCLAEEWDGYGTALKPAHEPIILARKPLDGTMANNIEKWGVGPLAIDATRIGTGEGRPHIIPNHSPGFADVGVSGGSRAAGTTNEGRWPANLLFAHSARCTENECVEHCPIGELDRQSGDRPGGRPVPAVTKSKPLGGPVFGQGLGRQEFAGYADNGGASRFFYCVKAGRKERELGCESLPMRTAAETVEREEGSAGMNSPRAGAGRTSGARNHHPTVKPIRLIQYLATLILPPTEDACLLVPYCGSGSEIIGALLAGWPEVLGIEREAEYIEIAHARIPANVRKVA